MTILYVFIGACVGGPIGLVLAYQITTWWDERERPSYQRTGWRYRPYVKKCDCKDFPCSHSPGQRHK